MEACGDDCNGSRSDGAVSGKSYEKTKLFHVDSAVFFRISHFFVGYDRITIRHEEGLRWALIFLGGIVMKKLVVVLAALLLCAGVCFAADPCIGYWKSVDDESGKVTAIWKVYTEGGLLYGDIVVVPGQNNATKASKCKTSYKGYPKSGNVQEMPVAGSTWIFGLKNKGDGKWGNGNIIDPGSGSMYTCTMTYKNGTLDMKGSIGPIGRTQTWLPCTEEEALSTKKQCD